MSVQVHVSVPYTTCVSVHVSMCVHKYSYEYMSVCTSVSMRVHKHKYEHVCA